MGGGVVFIGDELTAAGFRMAGIRVVTPGQGEARARFDEARAEADMIYITPEFAEEVGSAVLDEAMRGASPVVLIVPDLNRALPVPNLPAKVLGILGLET